MNACELEKQADLIWSVLNCKENADKSKDDQIKLIKPIILKIAEGERQIDRKQILTHMATEIENLKEN